MLWIEFWIKLISFFFTVYIGVLIHADKDKEMLTPRIFAFSVFFTIFAYLQWF